MPHASDIIFLVLLTETGHVDKRILKHYWKVAPKKERRQLLGRDDDEVKLSDLPPEWTSHVTEIAQT